MQSLLSQILDAEKSCEFMLSLFRTLKEGLEKQKQEQSARKLYIIGHRDGKISAIKAVWQIRFGDKIPDECLEVLQGVLPQHMNFLSDVLRYLTTDWTSEAIIAEIQRISIKDIHVS